MTVPGRAPVGFIVLTRQPDGSWRDDQLDEYMADNPDYHLHYLFDRREAGL
jgi:hypothetical protein